MKDLLERHLLNLANIVASPANPRAATSNRDFAFDRAGNVIDGAHRVKAVKHMETVDRAELLEALVGRELVEYVR